MPFSFNKIDLLGYVIDNLDVDTCSRQNINVIIKHLL